jgi:hypothetical protein
MCVSLGARLSPSLPLTHGGENNAAGAARQRLPVALRASVLTSCPASALPLPTEVTPTMIGPLDLATLSPPAQKMLSAPPKLQ